MPGDAFSLKGPKSIDTNGDGAIDANEIKARIQAWIDMKVGLTCPIVKFVDKKGKAAKEQNKGVSSAYPASETPFSVVYN